MTIWLLGAHPLWLWLSLPFAVFLSGYAPTAISFGAGQAMFALLVVELFNLIAPEGWEVGRGAPGGRGRGRGRRAGRLAHHVAEGRVRRVARRSRRDATRASLRFVRGRVRRAGSRSADPARRRCRTRAALALRRRSDEAFAAYVGERGAKRVPLEVWGWLVRVPIVMRAAADAAVAMERSGFHGVEQGDAARLFDEALADGVRCLR